MKIVITGGHHSSALPVISLLKQNYPATQIYWIGHRRTLKNDKNDTLEYKEISQLDIPFYDLQAGKFYKTYDPIRLLKIPFGFFQSIYYLMKIHPDLIVSFGGYIAVPVVIAGWFMGIPSLTHEQTVVVGYANKLISKFAKKVLISWDTSEKYFNKSKVIYTGLPIREEIKEAKTSSFIFNNELPILFILGGKTGSHILNEVIYDSLPRLLQKYNIIHQCGDYSETADYEKLCNEYTKHINLPGRYYLRKFIFQDEIGEAYHKSNLVISRSGAHTMFELLFLKKPSLLIPIPWVSHNEQYENAKLLKGYGLSEILEEKDLTAESFQNNIDTMFRNIDNYHLKKEVSINSNSAARIVDEIITLYKQKK